MNTTVAEKSQLEIANEIEDLYAKAEEVKKHFTETILRKAGANKVNRNDDIEYEIQLLGERVTAKPVIFVDERSTVYVTFEFHNKKSIWGGSCNLRLSVVVLKTTADIFPDYSFNIHNDNPDECNIITIQDTELGQRDAALIIKSDLITRINKWNANNLHPNRFAQS